MEQADYDELAKFLRELAARFGESAFTDRRRLISLLSDHMPDARRDIRVIGSAVDERIFEALARARPEQLSMEIERLGAKMEDGLGIRSDVATSVVRACAYGLSLGPLPSSFTAGATAPVRSWVGDPSTQDSWVGLSVPVPGVAPAQTPGSPPAAMTAPALATAPAAAMEPWKKWLLGGGGAVVAVLVGLGILGSQVRQPDRNQPPPQPVVQPAQPSQPVVQPTIPVAPAQPPYVPQAPVQQPPEQQPVTFFGGEDYDFHVPPQSTLKKDVGTPTPLTIPGVITVTTSQVMVEMQNNRRMILIDALGNQHAMTIKGAVFLPDAGKYGNFNDQVQTVLVNALSKLMQGHREVPLVFFCAGTQCWESYNAALRAKYAGFQNVYWFRGGLYAWQSAGYPMQPTQ